MQHIQALFAEADKIGKTTGLDQRQILKVDSSFKGTSWFMYLSHTKGDVGVLVGLIGVNALSIIPEQISTGWAVVRERRD